MNGKDFRSRCEKDVKGEITRPRSEE